MSDKKQDKRKMIFAKATAVSFCAIVVYPNKGKMMVCDIVNSDNIENFIDDIEMIARKHKPELLHYECSIYLHECKDLRIALYEDNIKVRGYKSEGQCLAKIVGQSSWIENNVLVNEDFTEFVDQMMSFSLTDPDDKNIALDILSDATKYLRKNIFK